jgi:LysR family cys regulon transcriptional activator
MNFQQLRAVREATRHGFNLTEVATALFTSQPGVSRQIRELEDELGIVIFERNGKRLTGLTDPGKGVLKIVDRLLLEAENLQNASREFAGQQSGTLTVAATHTQARYVLPKVVQAFRAAYPAVRIALQQSAPEHIAEWILSGKTDIGIATEGLSAFPDLVSFPCYRWSHLIVVPDGHPLLAHSPIRLEDLAAFPLITYDVGFTGRGRIDAAFAKAGVQPEIVLTAMDSDVIKQYVSLGLGVGIMASMAFDHGRDKGLRAVEASHLFALNTTLLAVRRGAYLRSYAYDFITEMAPEVSRADIERAVTSEDSDT